MDSRQFCVFQLSKASTSADLFSSRSSPILSSPLLYPLLSSILYILAILSSILVSYILPRPSRAFLTTNVCDSPKPWATPPPERAVQ